MCIPRCRHGSPVGEAVTNLRRLRCAISLRNLAKKVRNMATSRMLGIKSDENCWKHGRIYEAKSMFSEQFKKTINVNRIRILQRITLICLICNVVNEHKFDMSSRFYRTHGTHNQHVVCQNVSTSKDVQVQRFLTCDLTLVTTFLGGLDMGLIGFDMLLI